MKILNPSKSRDPNRRLGCALILMAPLPCAAVIPAIFPLRLLRAFFTLLIFAGVLAVVAAALVFSPIIQTWWVGRSLARLPNLSASVGSVSAGLSHVRLVNLVIKHDDFVLTVPSLEADLPTIAAWWGREAKVRTFTAKDWTLDLTAQTTRAGQSAARSGATGAVDPVKQFAAEFRGLLGDWSLPCDLTVDAADLNGEILLPHSGSGPSSRMTLSIKGGGLAPGRPGEFAVEAKTPPALGLGGRGQITVALGSPRRIQRLAFEGRITAGTGQKPEEFELSARLAAADATRAESYFLELRSGTRPLATVDAELVANPARLRGTWKLNRSDSDPAQFFPGLTLPGLALTGAGNFETDLAFASVRLVGRAHAAPSNPSSRARDFARIGATGIESEFALVRAGTVLRVERFNAAVNGPRPIATARSLQPFEFDLGTAAVRLSQPDTDWLDGSLVSLPLASLDGLIEGVAFTGGDIAGEFSVAHPAGNFVFRSKKTLTASGVAVSRAGKIRAQGLDLTLDLLAEHNSEGWQFQGAPLVIAHAGRTLATVEAKLLPPSQARSRAKLTGQWQADLDAIAAQPLLAEIASGLGRSTTGSFTLNTGRTTDVKAAIKLIGHTADRSVSIDLQTTVDARGDVTFKAPVILALGNDPTTVHLSGQSTNGKSGKRLDADASGVDGDLADLSRFAKALGARAGIRWPEPPHDKARDPQPFWHDWNGRLKLEFYRLRSGLQEFSDVAATVHVEPGAVRLEDARAVLAPMRAAPAGNTVKRDDLGPARPDQTGSRLTADGTITFAPADEFPYRLKVNTAIDTIDSARIFGSGKNAQNPVIEGRFALATTFTGQGLNLNQLIAGRREEFRVSAKDGVIRLLKANVAAAIPGEVTPVQDTLAQAGSMVGWVLGIQKGAVDNRKTTLSKATLAALDLSYELPELLFDELNLVATREADRVIRISSLSLYTPRVSLTGTGQIDPVENLPLGSRPLQLDLKIGAKDRIAQLFATAGLLSSDKSERGYALIKEPIRFGGTLETPDNSAWHKLLVNAATTKPGEDQKAR